MDKIITDKSLTKTFEDIIIINDKALKILGYFNMNKCGGEIMIERNKTICFSGHRTEKLPKRKDKFNFMIQSLYNEINKAVTEGYGTFMFGACYGFDLICAEQVLKRKQIIRIEDPVINLIAVVPFEDQAARWKEQERDKYFEILSKCDDVIILNKQYKSGCYHERNRYMVDNSSKLICYYDGSSGGTRYTVEYSERQKMQIINLCNDYTSSDFKIKKHERLMQPIK
ncbi:MAG: SLOG family protein [Vulcanibacillus sp.]